MNPVNNTAEIFELPQPIRLSKSQARAQRKADKEKKTKSNTAAPLVGKTPKQVEYLDLLKTNENVFAIGPAGTGKSYMASRIAARQLIDGKIAKIIIARPTVTQKRHELGFLPGKLEQKLAPWLIPLLDGIRQEVGATTVDQWQKEQKLEFVSFEHCRGRTLRDATVILDEAQNCTFSDLKLFLTRIGEDAQIVVTGDVDQIDIKDSGLARILMIAQHYGVPMKTIIFGEQDVVRSPFVREWVRAFAQEAVDRDGGSLPEEVNLDALPAFLQNAPNVMKNRKSDK